MSLVPRPLALIILDGWGHREQTEYNAIALAHKPHWDLLWDTCPHTLISGSGRCVGLPHGQMGNSEVGHLTMGAGRLVLQDLTQIDLAIEEGHFFSNPVFLKAIDQAVSTDKAVHVMGLLSDGGVHAHARHFYALLELAAQRQAKDVYIHAFLDGRDTPPQSAEPMLFAIMEKMQALSCGKMATLMGRFFGMDRDNRWERIQQAYELLVMGKGYKAPDPKTALNEAYKRGETDEFVSPTQILPVTIQDGDVVIFMNYRADRARELTRAFLDPNFSAFPQKRRPVLADYVTLTEYDATLKTSIAFPPTRLDNILGAYLSHLKLKQLRIAETEKYAHVTFFFNGGRESPFPGEERVLIPSPKVATYDLKPEMSAYELTDALVACIKDRDYDVIICNFANPDMVGHTGNLAATIQSIEVIDACLGRIVEALKEVGGEALITADHGNAELMYDKNTGQAHTAHTEEYVPLIYLGRPAKIVKENGKLSDIAPTMLYVLNLPQPNEMTGHALLEYL